MIYQHLRASAPWRAVLTACLTLAVAATAGLAQQKVTFDEHVKPIFRQHCQACHSQDDASGGLALDDYGAVLAGGAGGEVLASADASSSRLWKLVNQEEQPFMPPGGDKLPEDQLKIIRAWIEGGLLKDQGSKPKPSAKPAIAEVATDNSGKPQGEPALPTGMFRQPVVTSARPGPVLSLAVSRWAPVVAVPWQRQISFYHTKSQELLGIAPYTDGTPQVVRFSRDGSLLLVAGGRHGALGNAALYDVKTGARLATLGDELDIVLAADISPDKSLVALGGPKKKVRVYHTQDGSQAYELGKHTDWITALAFSPDGKFIATADRAGGLRTSDAREGHERGDLRGHNKTITSLAWRSDSSVLASASQDGTIRLWDANGKPIKSITAHGGGALSVDFAADGKLASAGRDQQVKLWKPDGGHLMDLAKMDDIALAAVFCNQGQQVAAADYAGGVRLIDVESKKTVATLAPNPPLLRDRLVELAGQVERSKAKRRKLQSAAEAALAALTQGQTAHNAYQQRLADANAALQKAEQRHAKSIATTEQAIAALTSYKAAHAKAKKAKQSALQKLESYNQQPTPEDATPEQLAGVEAKRKQLEATLAENESAFAAADSQFAKARDRRSAAEQALEAASLKSKQAQSLLADIGNQQAGLPDLAKLKQSNDKARSAAREASKRLTSLAAKHDAAASEVKAFLDAGKQLASQSQTTAEQQDQIAQALGAAEAERAALTQATAAQSAEIAQQKSQLDELKRRLQRLQQEQRELMAKLKQGDQRLTEVKRQFTAAQHAAQIAEALVRDFTAASAMREAYAEQQAKP